MPSWTSASRRFGVFNGFPAVLRGAALSHGHPRCSPRTGYHARSTSRESGNGTDASWAARDSTSRRSRSAATCSAGRPTSRRRSDCSTRSSRAGVQPHRHGRFLFALGARPSGRRIRDDHRPLDRAARTARRRGHRDQGRLRHGTWATGACAPTTSCRRPRRRCGACSVDAIDLYQSHWDDDKTPFDETLEAYARLIRQGKVKAIGASNLTAERLAQALAVSAQHGYPRYQTLQPHYNLYERASFEGAARRPVRAREHRRHHLFLAGRRIPDGQIPQRGGFCQERARRGHAEVHESARIAHPGRARRVSRNAAARRWRRSRWPGSCIGPASRRPLPARRRSRSSTS